MIDLRTLREHPDRLRASQRARGEDDSIVDTLLDLDERRRAALTSFESLRAEQKSLGKSVSRAQGEEKAGLLQRAKDLAGQVKAAEAEAETLGAELDELVQSVPNIVDEDAPHGGEDDYVVLETHGRPRVFDFEPKDHLELGEQLGAIDMERGAKVSGSRFYFLKGVGARLQLGLLNMAMQHAIANGFTPMITPVLVKPETMQGTGFHVAHDKEIYRLPDDDLYLVGTSEVALAGYHAQEILGGDELPLRYAGWSSCFRREAGSYGKDTRGIIRVHQFDKVEMFSYVRPEEAREEHQRLLAWEKDMLDKIEVPYRVIDTAAGDLGMSAARKFDCEAWIPTQGRYRELTSTSNCTDFQTRRLDTRGRFESA
ncbi:MAG TPA: serine--tRNA ligase, partial [Nonomuraea sp.]|nr:serine--tRNA ligase [Nonomuraea sp.]